ncbi:hypothetical protein PGT21_033148 [Puccinia graminis f. sp. tritici]|uniref:RRM domain-containing protein n=1 Tax=Puccinia graminis f. sp. tritici TaxID=56615 RepID=A0A5B0P254_PUCGR|nr:hypothetical protein PGTUg99_009981 [Puccinia graminis f. sp. tritici]KAA1094942.1 hypothetical protein PGT21_033148 [Puccinia graminis f. sp. tritici]
MASPRGRSASPKPLRTENLSSKTGVQDPPNGLKKSKASPRSRSPSGSRRSSRAASVKSRRSDSRSMSLSRSSSDSRSRSRSYSSSRSRSPRRKRGRSYSGPGSRSRSRSRSRSASYSSYSSRSDSRDSAERTGGGSKVVEVSKLTKNVTAEHVREIFKVYGTIREVDLPIVRRIGSHRGTAIVTYDTDKAAQKAVSHMNRGQLDGSLISVQIYRSPSPPRGPAALRRGSTTYRATSGNGNRYAAPRGPNIPRRNGSPPRRSFGGRSRSPPRRSFADSRPAGRPNRSRTPPYRRKRSLSRSPSRSSRRGVRRPSPQYGGRSSRRNRSYSRSDSSSYTRSSVSRSRSPRK